MRALPSHLRAYFMVIALAGAVQFGAGTGPLLGQMSVEQQFRNGLGDLEALRDQFGEAYRSGGAQTAPYSETQSANGSSYQAIYEQWLRRGGPGQGQELETALDRDPQALANMLRPPPGEVTPFVVGIGARAVGSNADATGQRFRETVAILQTRGVEPGGAALSGLCTGVLVSDLTVLTAAHCICDLGLLSAEGRSTAVVVHDAVADRGSRYLLNGSEFSNNPGLIATQAARSSRVDAAHQPALLDPAFCAAISQGLILTGKDLGLVYLDPSRETPNYPDLLDIGVITASPDRAKAQFAPPELLTSPALRHMTVVGFGISDFISDDRRYWAKVGVRVPVADATCHSGYAQANYACVPGREAVLVDGHTGGDTCRGDSGGPAFIRYFGAYYVAGITSRSATGGRCGEGGIYTLITPRVRTWINWRKRVGDPAF
jgi:hypothetical protein